MNVITDLMWLWILLAMIVIIVIMIVIMIGMTIMQTGKKTCEESKEKHLANTTKKESIWNNNLFQILVVAVAITVFVVLCQKKEDEQEQAQLEVQEYIRQCEQEQENYEQEQENIYTLDLPQCSYNIDIEQGCNENINSLFLNTQIGNQVIYSTDTLGQVNTKLQACGIEWKVYNQADGEWYGKGEYKEEALNTLKNPQDGATLEFNAIGNDWENDFSVKFYAINDTDKVQPIKDLTLVGVEITIYDNDMPYYVATPYIDKNTKYNEVAPALDNYKNVIEKTQFENILVPDLSTWGEEEKLAYSFNLSTDGLFSFNPVEFRVEFTSKGQLYSIYRRQSYGKQSIE